MYYAREHILIDLSKLFVVYTVLSFLSHAYLSICIFSSFVLCCRSTYQLESSRQMPEPSPEEMEKVREVLFGFSDYLNKTTILNRLS